MQFGFMSSVCPALTLTELIDKAKCYDYRHLELRVEWHHRHGVELNASPAFLREAKARFQDSGIALSCIATGCKFISPIRSERTAQVELLKRYIQLAETMDAQNVRFFGDPVPRNPINRDKTFSWQAEGIRACDTFAGEAGVTLCLETHGNLTGTDVHAILYQAEAKHTFCNWHPAHHVRQRESVDTAYAFLQGKIRHVHIGYGLDSFTTKMEQDALTHLARDGYTGFVSIEVINPHNPNYVLQHALTERGFYNV